MYPTITFFYIYNRETFELIDFSTDEHQMICNLQNFQENYDLYFESDTCPDLILSSVTYEDRGEYSMSDWAEFIQAKINYSNPNFDIEDSLPF